MFVMGLLVLNDDVKPPQVVILLDFKFNFTPDKADKIAALHERVADRLHWLCTTNQGLYIKLGQALGMQAAILPKPYQVAFANIFDAAPPCTYDEIERVFVRDFGKPPQEVRLVLPSHLA